MAAVKAILRQPVFKQVVVSLSQLDFEVSGERYEIDFVNECDLMDNLRLFLDSKPEQEELLALFESIQFMADIDTIAYLPEKMYKVMCKVDSSFSKYTIDEFLNLLVANVDIRKMN